LFISVKDLELRKIRFETSFAPGLIDLKDTGVVQTNPIEVSGYAELSGPLLDIRVRGQLIGRLEGNCDRCLEAVPVPADGQFELLYSPAGSEPVSDEKGLTRADTDVGYYEGAGIELSDVVREQLLLGLPTHIRCREDCKGICAICGANRNRESCGCQPPKIDERWEALKRLQLGE
jgi:uncharacterized protein